MFVSRSIDKQMTNEERRAQTGLYIETLKGSRNARVTFQTSPEGGPCDIGPRILHGTLDDLWDELDRLNQAGQAIYMMVNDGDGLGRSAKNVVGLTAVFIDDDGDGPVPKPPMDAAPPTMVVQSSRGPQTFWGLVPGEPKEAFAPTQVALAKYFGTDETVKDLPRVMRVPGFYHLKDRENPFLVTITEVRPARYTIPQVVAAYSPGVEAANEPMGNVPRKPAAKGEADTSMAVRRAQAYLAKVPGAVQGEAGDAATYQVACVLVRDFALTAEQALPLFLNWNETCVPPWQEKDLVAKLHHAAEYGTGEVGSKLKEDPDNFEGTEDLCFVVPLGRYYLRLPGGQWDLSAPLTKDPAMKHLRSLGLDEKFIKNTLDFDLMPLAHGIDIAPGEAAVFERDGRLVVNSYRPPRLVPAPGEWPRIRAIIETVTDHDPAGYAWLWNWMAAKYQNPGARSMTAPVFQGAQGVGKTKLGLILAALLGEENTASISQADLESQFNGHYVAKLFVIADEVVNQDNIRDTASVLKKYITDPRIIMNVKNLPQCEVMNRMSWWFTSNSITPVRVEGPNDRRYTVFAALNPPSADYKAMLEGIHRPDGFFTEEFQREMAAFADALARHQVDRALATRPYENAAREALINASRSSAELFLAEVEERGVLALMAEFWETSTVFSMDRWDFGDDGVTVKAVYGSYRRYCEACGMPASKKEKFGQEMRLMFPRVERTRAMDGEKRVYVYRGLPRQARVAA